MAYVTVPKDLTKVKSKVMFNLTKRQLICFTPAVLLGVPLFFLTRGVLRNSTATLLMILVMLPFFFLAMLRAVFSHHNRIHSVIKEPLATTNSIPQKVPNESQNLMNSLCRTKHAFLLL